MKSSVKSHLTARRWDLKMGQRGQLDRLHVAHTAAVMALDWCPTGGVSTSPSSETAPVAAQDASSGGLGWLVSGGLDRTVKVSAGVYKLLSL